MARFWRVYASLDAVTEAEAILDPSRRPKRSNGLQGGFCYTYCISQSNFFSSLHSPNQFPIP
jgi:hypothetical protein